jgi:3-oxoacyl-[acyl-carrier-protein] synthase-1
VGGVDTYLDLFLLGALDAESRVLGEGVMDGFIPGEGAAFLLLGTPGAGRAAGNAAVRVVSVGTGKETGHRYSEEPYRGEGLAETLQAVFTNGGSEEPVKTVLAGFNGEHMGSKEWGTAFLRSRANFTDDMRMEHPIDCFGDPGAALGPLLVALGAIAIREGHLEAPCLAWASSDREERGAALLQRF